VDMTRLRDDGTILPIFPVEDDEGEMRGKVHYKVEYDLVAIVEGLQTILAKFKRRDRLALLLRSSLGLGRLGHRRCSLTVQRMTRRNDDDYDTLLILFSSTFGNCFLKT
jgi:hypothetical protein